uniref:Thioredoxin domain-containing protein n=1 Tax=Neobodo designis TaxID=312471 RepID=A0A7S1M1S8_NEODS|mmetsp:Transcript_32660/g.101015  ORF Transcript_32660/g.101015 Transcript_32660/m.101015 type:complete len:232 (+) Transcript_32660:48-743(+)|eukprot:CAMPEP_0174829852 /NCGR_PEP_ID=MMETSP1114-20130205/2187_1 /TAXON_ID=312471 /ORGANISM="Neobodo designis, Strain CCAP 1951/1" /LENGTH=231 /DNA_ID=CAMNT_0016063623 /DNA_START=48 /DNA_END=743 /DNA_ORIENTATION=+
MLGRGKSSGVINEATNQHTNERLTAAVDEMKTAEYQKQRERDTTDVIPTHRHLVKKEPVKTGDEHLQVFTNDKKDSESDDDFDLEALRAQRAQAIKKEQSKMAEWRQKQHGSYREIAQDDFFATVVKEKGGSEHVVVHFYHDDFEKCKIMDRHLLELSHRIMAIRFVKVNVANAPFLVEKLKITVLPCLVLFAHDIAVDRVLGFEDFGEEDFDPELLRHRIETGLGLIDQQ